MWSILAFGVVAVHAVYLVYQMCGGLLALRNSRWLVPHLAAVTWGVVIVAMQWKCPLTSLEKVFLARAGTTPYSGSFLDHYVFSRYLPEGSQPWVYGVHLLVIVLVYALLVRAWARSRPPQLARRRERWEGSAS